MKICLDCNTCSVVINCLSLKWLFETYLHNFHSSSKQTLFYSYTKFAVNYAKFYRIFQRNISYKNVTWFDVVFFIIVLHLMPLWSMLKIIWKVQYSLIKDICIERRKVSHLSSINCLNHIYHKQKCS